MKRTPYLLALPLLIGAACASASDSNPLGFYVGGSVGRADVRSDVRAGFDESNTGWKLVAGARPIPLVAAEFEYINFGHPHSTANLGSFISESDTRQRAAAVSGLVFLPIPIPILDIYARAGLARLESRGSNRVSCNTRLVCPAFVIAPSSFNRTDTDLLYGAGVQLKLTAVSVRLEYERINDRRGDPDMLSAGVTWTF